MQELPAGVVALNEDPYNVGGRACAYCDFPTRELALQVLERAFAQGPVNGFSPWAGEPGDHRARLTWEFNGETYIGDVLVDATLTPVGFIAEVHFGEMVFNLQGNHIPYPRFAS